MKKIYVLLLLLTLGGAASAQNPCKELLAGYVKELGNYQKPGKDEVYQLAMLIKNTGSTKEVPDIIQVNAYMSNDFMLYDSELMSVYQDTVDSFVLLHDSKTILRNKARKHLNQDEYVNLVHQFQLSMIIQAKLNACADIEENGKTVKMIDITPDPASLQRDDVRFLTFYLDEEEKRIARVVISYDPKSTIKRQEINYQIIKLHKSFKKEPVRHRLFAAADQETLLPKYKSYRLIDNRK